MALLPTAMARRPVLLHDQPQEQKPLARGHERHMRDAGSVDDLIRRHPPVERDEHTPIHRGRAARGPRRSSCTSPLHRARMRGASPLPCPASSRVGSGEDSLSSHIGAWSAKSVTRRYLGRSYPCAAAAFLIRTDDQPDVAGTEVETLRDGRGLEPVHVAQSEDAPADRVHIQGRDRIEPEPSLQEGRLSDGSAAVSLLGRRPSPRVPGVLVVAPDGGSAEGGVGHSLDRRSPPDHSEERALPAWASPGGGSSEHCRWPRCRAGHRRPARLHP